MLTCGPETSPGELMPEHILVDKPDSIATKLESHARIGVDTEFMREKTFFAELCLVQVSCNQTIYCVDPLNGNAMDAFWENLTGKTWVVHSARQDIEVIYQTAQKMPSGLFDTQIAAGLLGHAPQLGYANLVKELFDVEVPKSHTRANWSRRPLPDEYLHYAAEDVEFLLPAHDVLAAQLEDKGRLAWAEEDSMLLLDPALYDVDPGLAIDRMKGARNLRGKRRTAAARLAAWRESEALRANRPRQWIAKDSVLLEIASRLPSDIDALTELDGLPPGLIRRAGKDIIAAVAAARADANDYAPPRPPDESQKALLKAMQKLVAGRAAELRIAAETLASKRDLSAVLLGGDDASRVLQGWRRRFIGDELLQML